MERSKYTFTFFFSSRRRHTKLQGDRSSDVCSSDLYRIEPGILLDAIGSGGAEPGLGRGNASRFTLAETHKQPHLAIGDVATGQGAVPHRREEPASYPAGRDRQTTRPFQGRAGRRIRDVSRATPSCRRASGDSFSSRLTRASHPVCRAAGRRELMRVDPLKRGFDAGISFGKLSQRILEIPRHELESVVEKPVLVGLSEALRQAKVARSR